MQLSLVSLKAACNLNLCMAVDFTMSDVDCASRESLHLKCTISGNILCDLLENNTIFLILQYMEVVSWLNCSFRSLENSPPMA